MKMINVYGYNFGCAACDELKRLLIAHRIDFTFTEVEKGNHCFKTVPQSFSGGMVCGGLDEWKKHLTPKKEKK